MEEYTAAQAKRWQNALLWIRMIAAMHYLGEAFEPEHMRAIANVAANALADERFGGTFPDYEQRMAAARVRASRWAERMGAELARDDDDDELVPTRDGGADVSQAAGEPHRGQPAR